MSGRRLVHLVRHGETEGESSVRYHGRNDVPLSELGRQQARRLRPWLQECRFVAVVHSPLRRAAESAAILVDGLAESPAAVESHDGFREIDFGRIEGMTDGEVRAAFPEWYAEWRGGRTDGYPGGDSLAGFAERVAAAWDDVVARHPEGDLLVVVHRGVIKRVLMHALGLPETEAMAVHVDLGSLTVLRCGVDAELVSLNRVPTGE